MDGLFVFSLLLAGVVYGTFPFLVCGLAICRHLTHCKPFYSEGRAITIDFTFSKEEISALRLLDAKQDDLRRQKVKIYFEGDQLGLGRRQSDGRFDARGSGKQVNAKLSRLDGFFAATEDEILRIRMNHGIRCGEKVEEYNKWRPKYSLWVAFRRAVVVFLVSLPALLTLNLYFSLFSSIFPSVTLASVLATTTLLYFRESMHVSYDLSDLGWTGNYNPMSTDSIQELYDESLREFMKAEDATECVGTEEYAEWESDDRAHKPDERQSPYDTLGVRQDASREQITAAYHELIKQYHPDYQQQRGPELRELAERKSKQLNWAKEEALKRV